MAQRGQGSVSLQSFSLGDMLRFGVEIRRGAAGCSSMEAAAESIVCFLYDTLRVATTGERASVLLRAFVTLPFRDLPAELREIATRDATFPLVPSTRCLVLLSTRGDSPPWNDRHASKGHAVIPLPNVEAVEGTPMIARMVTQMGLDIDSFVGAPRAQRPAAAYDVFFVPEAIGSPHIPAQADFVGPFGVQSVVGFGGVLQEEFFFFLLFSREPIPESTASRFRTIAIDARLALLKHERQSVFDPESPVRSV